MIVFYICPVMGVCVCFHWNIFLFLRPELSLEFSKPVYFGNWWMDCKFSQISLSDLTMSTDVWECSYIVFKWPKSTYCIFMLYSACSKIHLH